MKLTQYTTREAQITSADSQGIRQRWMWGLRLLRDPDAFTSGSTQLRPGFAEALTKAAAKRGLKLSAREIRYRLQCARAYPTETEFGKMLAEFQTWFDLLSANFPAFEAPPGEPLADWRTEPEKTRDRNRAWLDASNGMDAMFPLSDFEPVETTLEDLENYMKDSLANHQSIVAGFEHTHAKRRDYLDRLEEAAGYDLSMTWQEAQDLLPDDDDDDAADAS
jgi:hypothetical protein